MVLVVEEGVHEVLFVHHVARSSIAHVLCSAGIARVLGEKVYIFTAEIISIQ